MRLKVKKRDDDGIFQGRRGAAAAPYSECQKGLKCHFPFQPISKIDYCSPSAAQNVVLLSKAIKQRGEGHSSETKWVGGKIFGS